MSDQEERTPNSQSSLETLINVYSNPSKAFESISEKANWLFPVLLIILVGIISTIMISDITVDVQKNAILESERIPEEQKDALLEDLEDPSFMREYGISGLGVIFYVFAGFALVALAFMVVGNFILGGEASFKQNYALFAWGSTIGILESIIKIPLIISKNSVEVYTSLAILMDQSESKTVLFQILNAFDIFAIWKVIVLSIGFSVLYKFSRGKSYTAIGSLYAIYILIAIGLSQLFGGLF